jgi:hypothetical protein
VIVFNYKILCPVAINNQFNKTHQSYGRQKRRVG